MIHDLTEVMCKKETTVNECKCMSISTEMYGGLECRSNGSLQHWFNFNKGIICYTNGCEFSYIQIYYYN